VKFPTLRGDGLRELIAGSGTTVAAALPTALGSALLRACTLTVDGDGTEPGAL
jgi:hypothetical protein